MDMTVEEQGAYRNLLDEAHLRGGALPLDERILAKACGDAFIWKRVRNNVMARFVEYPDGWHNETLDGVISESKRRATKQRDYRNRGNGQGNVQGNGSGNAVGNDDGNDIGNQLRPPVPVPVPISSSGSGSEKTLDRLRDRFDAFWDVYPRKVGKDAALKEWLKHAPDAALTEAIIAAVNAQKFSPNWQKDGGQFIPHPRTWLHQGRWQDEVEPQAQRVMSEAAATVFRVLEKP